MDLLTISDNKVIPSAYTLIIPEFKVLAVKELAYVYYMCDNKSPFSVYDDEKRHEEVCVSVFGKEKEIGNKVDLVQNLSRMGDVINGLSKLEEQVKKEEQASNQNRGGVITNKYSQ